jgi:DNA-directed RNA polymerase subunit RPC12/RpoP
MSETDFEFQMPNEAVVEQHIMAAYEAFQAADPLTQAIIMIFLCIGSVCLMTFAIYMMKLFITFIVKMIKGIVKTAGAKPVVSLTPVPQAAQAPQTPQAPYLNQPVQNQPVYPQQAHPQSYPTQSNNNVQPAAQNRLNIQTVQPEQPAEIDYFCSNCGAKFSKHMIGIIKAQHKAFCEQCGQGFMVAEN